MSSTIIVGAGINGMLLGALLARGGEKVTLLEKNRVPGGRAFLYEHGGYVMDYGVHLTRFGPESALAKIMKHIGSEITFRKLGPSYLIDRNGRRVLFPTSLSGFLKSEMFTLYEKARLAGILLGIKKGEYNDGLMDVSLRDWMIRNNITGGIRRYMELLSASVMVCPFYEKTSAGEMFRILNKVLATGHSVEYPSAGWKPVHIALVSEIEKSGSIRCGVTVESVILQNGKAVGVTAAGGKRFTADRVVINLPVQELFTILPEASFSPAYVKMCRQLVPTSGIFFDIALDRRIADYDGLLYTYSPMTYGMITSNLVPGLAPEEGQILTMLYPATVEDVKDGALRIQRKDELWDAIKKFFPDIEQHVLWMRESSLRMLDGAQVNTTQTADNRPGAVVPGIRGLYLVGDSVAAPGAGGDIGNESVLAAYAAMTGNAL